MRNQVKTEDVTRYESDATPEEILERVPLRKQEFVLEKMLSNTAIAGIQDAVLMVRFVWSFSFLIVCLAAMTVKWYEVHERFAWKGRILDTRYLVCLTFWISFSEARSGYRHLQGHDKKYAIQCSTIWPNISPGNSSPGPHHCKVSSFSSSHPGGTVGMRGFFTAWCCDWEEHNSANRKVVHTINIYKHERDSVGCTTEERRAHNNNGMQRHLCRVLWRHYGIECNTLRLTEWKERTFFLATRLGMNLFHLIK